MQDIILIFFGICLVFLSFIVVSFIIALFWSMIIYFMHLCGISFSFINYRGEPNQDNIRYYLVENNRVNTAVKEKSKEILKEVLDQE